MNGVAFGCDDLDTAILGADECALEVAGKECIVTTGEYDPLLVGHLLVGKNLHKILGLVELDEALGAGRNAETIACGQLDVFVNTYHIKVQRYEKRHKSPIECCEIEK